MLRRVSRRVRGAQARVPFDISDGARVFHSVFFSSFTVPCVFVLAAEHIRYSSVTPVLEPPFVCVYAPLCCSLNGAPARGLVGER